MFENSPKKAIKDVASLPAVGDAKTIYRVTRTGDFYVFNTTTNTYKKLGASDFFESGSTNDSGFNKILPVYRVGNIGIANYIGFVPRYTLDIFQTESSFLGVGISGTTTGGEAGVIVTTKDDGSNLLGSSTNKGWKLYGKAESATEGANNLFLRFWNGVTWLSSMQMYSSTGSVVIGSPASSYSPANIFEVWGDAKFSAKIEDSAGSYGSAAQVLSSNGTAGGVRWNTLTTAWYTTGTTNDAGGSKTSEIYRTGSVGVGASPINTIDSAGSLGANIRSSAASLTTSTTDHTVVMTTTGTVVTLQTPSLTTTLRRIVSVKNMATGNITVTGNIDGTTQTLTLTTKESRLFHSNGVTWYII